MNVIEKYFVIIPIVFFTGCFDHSLEFGIKNESSNQTIIHGAVNLENKSYMSLQLNGAAHLDSIKVKDYLEVNGALKAEDCVLKKVSIRGALSLEDSDVSELLEVFGTIQCNDCKLKNVELNTNSAFFEDTEALDIVVKVPSQFLGSKQQKITLKNTKVARNITFEQEDGLVILIGSSKVKGKVVGGRIEEKNG